jgi:hypothetical protein
VRKTTGIEVWQGQLTLTIERTGTMKTRKLAQLTLLTSITALSTMLAAVPSAQAASILPPEVCSNSACVSDPICHYSAGCICFTTIIMCDGNEGCDD